MARPLRVEFDGAYYHVMNRALERHRIFESERDHEYFLTLLSDITERWDVKIFAYCLMGNHYHLFVQTPQGNISRVIRHVDGLYAQYFNRIRKRDGPLFRGRFKAIVVDADSYLLTLVRYIHLNPVKAGLVDHPASYAWSSHKLYVFPNRKTLWLERNTVLSNFENTQRFEEFICQGNDRSLEAFYKRKRFAPFLGSDSFVASMLKRISRKPSIGRSEVTPQFPDLESLITAVGQYFEVGRESLLSSLPGQENTPRNLAIYLAGRKAGFSHADIKNCFGLGSETSVSKVCWRAEEKLRTNADLKKAVQDLLKREDLSQVKT